MDEKVLSIYVFPSLTLVIHTIPENRAKRKIGRQIALNIFKLSLEQISCIRITRAKVKKAAWDMQATDCQWMQWLAEEKAQPNHPINMKRCLCHVHRSRRRGQCVVCHGSGHRRQAGDLRREPEVNGGRGETYI
jgi:hypothetical protein